MNGCDGGILPEHHTFALLPKGSSLGSVKCVAIRLNVGVEKGVEDHNKKAVLIKRT